MPNVHLTETMTRYAQVEVERGAYANISEVVRAGMRLLMERDGARGYFELKAAIDEGVAAIEAGEWDEFDTAALEPDSFAR